MIVALLGLAFADPYLSLDRELEDSVLSMVSQIESDRERWKVLSQFSDTVFPSARVYYEVGLLYNQSNQFEEALKYYEASLAIDADYVSSLYDSAELLLLEGEDGRQVAKERLNHIQKLDGSHWVVSYRLAQIAIEEGDAIQLKNSLKQALRSGMPTQLLIDDQEYWRQHLNDPQMSLTLEMFLLAIGQETIWRQLQTP